tara:strand:- start:32 stop:412 length:381 start_codon:yes stop_codon:yes gene_type:complete
MLNLTLQTRYFLYLSITDMRKGYDGLSGLVRNELKENPLSGDVFIFLNRRRNQVKLLCWENGGLAVYSKRLEQGTFELPSHNGNNEKATAITAQTLRFIIEGIQLKSVVKRKRFSLNKNHNNVGLN